MYATISLLRQYSRTGFGGQKAYSSKEKGHNGKVHPRPRAESGKHLKDTNKEISSDMLELKYQAGSRHQNVWHMNRGECQEHAHPLLHMMCTSECQALERSGQDP